MKTNSRDLHDGLLLDIFIAVIALIVVLLVLLFDWAISFLKKIKRKICDLLCYCFIEEKREINGKIVSSGTELTYLVFGYSYDNPALAVSVIDITRHYIEIKAETNELFKIIVSSSDNFYVGEKISIMCRKDGSEKNVWRTI